MNTLKTIANKHPWLVAISSGLLFHFAWLSPYFSVLLFVAFIPLFFLEEKFRTDPIQGRGRFFRHAFLAFLVWNILSTWWVCLSTLPGGIIALIGNSLLMCIPMVLWHASNKRFGYWGASFAFVVFWIALEYLHLNWELSWPWLVLGNGFANSTSLIQWYSVTGALGGSLWILTLNLVVWKMLHSIRMSYPKGGVPINFKPWIVFGILISLLPALSITSSISKISIPKAEKNDHMRVLIVQSNVDPHKEEFLNYDAQMENMRGLLRLTKENIDSTIDLVLWPETAFEFMLWEERLQRHPAIIEIRRTLADYPKAQLISGVVSGLNYKSEKKPTVSAKFRKEGEWFDVFNAAICINMKNTETQIYHKNKLVPGAERVPYFKILGFLESFAEGIAGEGIGNYGTGRNQPNFEMASQEKVVPLICYESIYGDFTRGFVKKGATILSVITNDGWWGKSSGKSQHLAYAKLRAIETDRYIVRSANTGNSAFIDPKGNILAELGQWEEGVLKVSVPGLNSQTIYVKHGDVIGRLSAVFSILLILILWLRKYSSRHIIPAKKAN